MERAVFVYTTYPSIVEAEQAGRALVGRRLCACVNILPGMVSLYWWQGHAGRGGARRGAADALLYDPRDTGHSDRKRRSRLPRLDHGGDGRGDVSPKTREP
jgi:hypothetical protein